MMIEKIIIIMMIADEAPMPISLRPKVNFCMKSGRRPVAVPGPPSVMRDDEIVGLDREMREHHESRKEHRAHQAE